MFDQPHDFIDVGHSELAYWKVGAGPDLLLLHGWPLHSGTFRALLPTLAQTMTCHLLDLPGAGWTRVRDEKAINLRRHAETVRTATTRLGLSRFSILAHDSGGAIARYIAGQYPEAVVSLVLGNTEVPGHNSWMFDLLVAFGHRRVGRWLLRQGLAHPLGLRVLLDTCFANQGAARASFSRDMVEPLRKDSRRRRRQVELCRDLDPNWVNDIPNQTLLGPTLLIWGEADPWFPLSAAEALQSRIPESRLERLPGKLYVHEEHPRRFAELAIQFLGVHHPSP